MDPGMSRKIYILIFCLLAILPAVMPSATNRRIKSAVEDTLAPFTLFLRGAAGALSGSRGDDGVDADVLAVELELARYEIARLKTLEQENRKLREMLGLVEDSSLDLLPAKVIGRNVSGWWRKVQLDKGAGDGIEPGMPVVSGRGLVGRVVSASSFRSDVLLMIDPSCRVSARVSGSGASGIVRGHRVSTGTETLCRMEFIERGSRIGAGDEVITSGLGGVFPQGVRIGTVRSVEVDPSGLYRNADIQPTTDFRWLDVVFVVFAGASGRDE